MTWIEVVDTSIKIGLGAVVAGLFGYLLSTHNYKCETTREYDHKRREFLSKTIECLNEYHKSYGAFRARYQEHIRRRDRMIEDTEEDIFILQEAEEKFASNSAALIDAESYLLAVQEKLINKELFEYLEYGSEILARFQHEYTTISEREIIQLNEKMRFKRRSLLSSIGYAYRG